MKQPCKASNTLQNYYLALLLLIFELIAALRNVNMNSHGGMTGSMNGSSSRAS